METTLNGFLAVNKRSEIVRVYNHASDSVVYFEILTGNEKGLTDTAALAELIIIPHSKNITVC